MGRNDLDQNLGEVVSLLIKNLDDVSVPSKYCGAGERGSQTQPGSTITIRVFERFFIIKNI